MSQRTRFLPDRSAPLPQLGAYEVDTCTGTPVNDNGPDCARPRHRRPAGLILSVVAFGSGVTAALLITGLGQFLGFGG